jgi:hypothetical protein
VLPSRGFAQRILAGVVLAVSLLVLLVAADVLAPADTGALGRYLQPFVGLRGSERVVVLASAAVLALLAASTFLTARAVLRAARRR